MASVMKNHFQEEDSHGVHHVENPVDANQALVLPRHEDKEMVSCCHTDELITEPLNAVGEHINDFIRVGRHSWEVAYSSFDGDPIYDIDGGFQVNNDKLFPS